MIFQRIVINVVTANFRVPPCTCSVVLAMCGKTYVLLQPAKVHLDTLVNVREVCILDVVFS